MRRIFISVIILIITSCTKINKKEQPTHLEIIHPIEEINKEIDKEVLDSVKQKFLDTTNVKNSPAKIISSKLLDSEYSNHKDIQLTYRNVSKKDIKAIKFEWYYENVFNEPASGKFFFVFGESTGSSTSF